LNISKNSNIDANLTTKNNTNLEASIDLKLVSKVNLKNDSLEFNENLTDGLEEIPAISSSSYQNKNTTKKSITMVDEESISSLAVSKIKNKVFLCVGTSKGSIIVWSLIDENSKIKMEKVHEFKEAHGKFEVDDLQVHFPLSNMKNGQKFQSDNEDNSVLLSIGKDNKCLIWSLKRFNKVAEIDYLPSLNNDTNLRMKHARFSSYSSYLYTTFIPRIRGGGKDMSSYIERWSLISGNCHFNYKLESKYRIKNTILTTIQCSKDGNYICVGDYEGRIGLYDLNFNKIIDFKKQHSSVITDLIFYHDFVKNENSYDDMNKLILTISIDRTLQCYKFINDKRIITKNKNLGNGVGILYSNTFKFVFIIILTALFFSYFFTFIE
jgi:hypothetical protein